MQARLPRRPGTLGALFLCRQTRQGLGAPRCWLRAARGGEARVTRLSGLCVVRVACFEWTFLLRETRCLRMGCEGLPFPDQLTVGPWGGDRGQGELFQGSVGGLGMPPCLGRGRPTLRAQGSAWCQASDPALPEAHLPHSSRHLFLLIPSPGASAPCPRTVPCRLRLPLQKPGFRIFRHTRRVCARLPGVVTAPLAAVPTSCLHTLVLLLLFRVFKAAI